MIANHIHDALGQVRRLQEFIIARRRFRGYSGVTRMVSGSVSLLAAALLAAGVAGPLPDHHLAVWAVVVALSVALNYGALAWWFFRCPETRRNPTNLAPAVDAMPALAAGAVFTVALVLNAHYDLLFGAWMWLFGLAHTAYRQSLPKGNFVVGLYYIACGTACLLHPGVRFTDPWPMGIVFFVGEWVGGIVLYRNRQEVNEP